MSLVLLIMIIFSFVVCVRSVIRERKYRKSAKVVKQVSEKYTGEF